MQCDAWCISLSNGQLLAVAQQQVVEYLTNVNACVVPHCNPHCNQVMVWRERVLPLWGIDGNHDSAITQHHAHVLVISYRDQQSAHQQPQTEPQPPGELLALSLSSAPLLISVRDEDQCLPAVSQQQYWRQAILACFQHQDKPVPVINFARL